MAQLTEATACFCAEYVGNYLYVAAQKENGFASYRYNTVSNSWETLPPFLIHALGNSKINCLCSLDNYLYAISSGANCYMYRYTLADNKWQGGANLGFSKFCDTSSQLSDVTAAVWKSHIYVLHGHKTVEKKIIEQPSFGYGAPNRAVASQVWVDKPAVLHCFDPAKNEWEQKASTCQPHFGSSLFVVDNRLYIADLCNGSPALVEVYDEQNNTWSAVEQKHIPPNNLDAVEIEGRVYFIVNKFPVDVGIRIPPEEVYHMCLNEWEKLTQINKDAVLCYLPVKTEGLKAEIS